MPTTVVVPTRLGDLGLSAPSGLDPQLSVGEGLDVDDRLVRV